MVGSTFKEEKSVHIIFLKNGTVTEKKSFVNLSTLNLLYKKISPLGSRGTHFEPDRIPGEPISFDRLSGTS